MSGSSQSSICATIYNSKTQPKTDFYIWPLRTENSSYLFQYGSVLILSLNTASENRTLSSWVIFVHIGPSILFVWIFILITGMICFVNFLFAFRLFLISYLCLPGCSYFPRGTPEGNMNCLLIPTILSPLALCHHHHEHHHHHPSLD